MRSKLLRNSRKTVAAHMESRTTPPNGCALGAPPKELRCSFTDWWRASVPFALFPAACIFLTAASLSFGQYQPPKVTQGVTIQQKLNSPMPLDLLFKDETGRTVPLRTYFGEMPVVLSPVYFKCPSLCPMSLRETVNGLRRLSLQAGRDYEVVVVSFDPADTPATAAQKKAEYAKQFDKPGFDIGWHFLTGSQESISKLTSAIGFQYRWDAASKQFVHAGGIMVATPDGRMSRYFYGIDYAPADLRMALVDASQHKIGGPVDYVLLYCFHWDPTLGKYTLAIVNVLKIAGALTVTLLGGLIFFLMRNDKRKNGRPAWKEIRHVG
jgi:protein SCO1/2